MPELARVASARNTVVLFLGEFTLASARHAAQYALDNTFSTIPVAPHGAMLPAVEVLRRFADAEATRGTRVDIAREIAKKLDSMEKPPDPPPGTAVQRSGREGRRTHCGKALFAAAANCSAGCI